MLADLLEAIQVHLPKPGFEPGSSDSNLYCSHSWELLWQQKQPLSNPQSQLSHLWVFTLFPCDFDPPREPEIQGVAVKALTPPCVETELVGSVLIQAGQASWS